MTLVSHRAGFIFLKTHKTASTSVEVALEPLCAPAGADTGAHYRPALISDAGIIGARGGRTSDEQWRNHMTAKSVRRLVGRGVWRRYTKITTVRNPYPRMVSMFHSRLTSEEREALSEQPFDDVRRSFSAWLATRGVSNNLQKLTIGPRYVIDHVIYFERLDADFNALAEALNLKDAALPRLKADRNLRPEPWIDYYNDDTRALVERQSAFELAFFGYHFASGAASGPRRAPAMKRAAPLLLNDPKRLTNFLREPRQALTPD